MAYQKNIARALEKNNPFPVQVKLWKRIYEKGDLRSAAKAIGKDEEWLSKVLDGLYDLKWTTVKALCAYLGIENPLEVLL